MSFEADGTDVFVLNGALLDPSVVPIQARQPPVLDDRVWAGASGMSVIAAIMRRHANLGGPAASTGRCDMPRQHGDFESQERFRANQ